MEKLAPHNEEAEKSVLGSILINPDMLHDVSEIIKADDFYFNRNKEIFEVAMELQSKGTPIDHLTICDELKRRASLDWVGGRGYVVALGNEVPSTRNAVAYAKIIYDNSELRKLIVAGKGILEQSYEPNANAEEVLSYAEQEVFNISQKKETHNTSRLTEILHENLIMIDERVKNRGQIMGIPSGFVDLDNITTGFQKSDMIVLAARPSMGKTSFALNVAQRAADKGNKIMIFSLEMSRQQIGMRFILMESKVDAHKLKMGEIGSQEWENIYYAIEGLSKGEITVDDTVGGSLTSITSKCRKLKAERGLDLIIIDYLQLIEASTKVESRLQEISSISRGIKQLAREMDCPVIVLSQLSRNPEARTNKRPILSDLRDSGAIEQDADQVIFLYRDDFYEKDSEEKGICEVIVAKNRNGPTETIKLKWQKEHTRFENLDYKSYL